MSNIVVDFNWIKKNLAQFEWNPPPNFNLTDEERRKKELNFLDYFDQKNKYCLDEAGNLTGLNLAAYPDEFELRLEFSHLEILYLRKSKLQTLHIPVSAKSLRSLTLAQSEYLRSLTFAGPLPSLEEGEWSECALEELVIPRGCDRLSKLFLARNQLRSFHFEGDCPALFFLELTRNRLIELSFPPGFQNLMYLYCGHNELRNLQFAQAPKELEIMFLRGNQLDELPLILAECTNLADLNLFDNPWTKIPKELISADERGNSRDAIMAYLDSLQGGKAVENDEVKLVLLGNTTSGKSTLFKYLSTGEYDPNLPSTHGIYGEHWQPEGHNFKVNVWDFGGQDYYHATHHLFLSNNAVALVLFEEKTNQQDEIELEIDHGPFGKSMEQVEIFPYSYWLAGLEYYGGEIPGPQTLLIQSKMDESKPYRISDKDIERYSLFEDQLFQISVKGTFEGMVKYIIRWSEFLDKMFGLLKKTKAIFQISSDWLNIKNELRALPSHIVTMSMDEYRTFCEILAPGISQVSTGQNIDQLEQLTTYLHKTGVLLHYPKHHTLCQIVFVKPSWVIDRIYKVLNLKVKAQDGCFSMEDAQITLENIADAQMIVDLMTEFQLIFIPRNHQEYVAPQYLPKTFKEPKHYERFKRKCTYGFCLRFPEFLPRNVMTRFICHYGRFSNDDFWKNGIAFDLNLSIQGGRVENLMVLVEKTGDLQIDVLVEKENATAYSVLFNTLWNITEKNKAIEIAVDGENFVRVEDILEHDWQNNKTIVATNKVKLAAELFVFMRQDRMMLLPEDEHVSNEVIERGIILTELHIPRIIDCHEEIPEIIPNRYGKKTVLFAQASPSEHSRIRVDVEHREIEAEIRNSIIELHCSPAVRFRDLNRDLNRYSPQIMHFSGHGSKGGLELESDDIKTSYLLENERLNDLFNTHKDTIQLIVLNSCYSFSQAEMLSKLGTPVICMLHEIADHHAIQFSIGLYQALVGGQKIIKAFNSGKNMMDNNKDTPALWYKGLRIA